MFHPSRRGLLSTAALAAAGLLALPAAASPTLDHSGRAGSHSEAAHAVPARTLQPNQQRGPSHLVNQRTIRCLDGNTAGKVYASPCDGNNNFEKWNRNGPTTAAVIVNYRTHRCLDSSGRNVYTTLPYNSNSLSQRWNRSGRTFVNNKTHYCLDSSGGNVYAGPCNGGDFQKWVIIP